MNKNFLTTFLFTFFMLSPSICFAQGTYVRKKISPNVYLPKSAMEKQEKLPEFYYPTQNNLKEAIDDLQDKEITHVEVKTEVVKTQKIVKKPINSSPQAAEKNQEDVSPEIVQNPTQEIIMNNKYAELLMLSNTDEAPVYTQKYDEYITDINTLIETSHMPQNELLEKDLSAMNSNLKKEFK